MMKHTEILDVKTDLLLPYPRNARKHSPEQIDKIMTSITEFGFLTPCVIGSDNTIIAGHARVAAAKKLGLESVPCVLAGNNHYLAGILTGKHKEFV